MSWMAVAEKDFRDAIRSRLLVVLTVLFAVFAAGAAYVVSEIDPPQQAALTGEVTTGLLIAGLVSATAVFIPIVAIAASYRSLAGERDSGSLKLLLSLPNSRRDIVAGKFVGRSAVVGVALLVGFAVGLVVTAVLADAFSVLEYLVFVAVSLLFALVFVAITVGVSAFTASTSRAAYGAFGLFVVFQFLWGVLVQGLAYALNGFSFPEGGEQFPEWIQNLANFLFIVDPTTAYQQGTLWVVRLLDDSQEAQETMAELPFYAQDWFGFVIMVVWIAVPLAVGYLRFDAADL
ncbi:ABC-type transport system permease protein [Natronomonas pharaonis DSM 2160]|uniref:ABC-type transport system permease protein n=1 Tax=Natronomonas pharaonis (strain ATCC 35678 / DSM 2160 / CIP 103997 / JCM 8858 / NBRC 14720 / NCIMB 2260 / Gabara) TaxID=348780 RepID=A0A1U7EUH5_NATPD|nr:ABC transporter permease [Natronomonas pharaonis]CAI48631.1 ABC-type transport system permease protein [Natronomonas pharaonis DSM 2160]